MARGIEVTTIPLTAVSGTPQIITMGGQYGTQGASHYPALGVPMTVTVNFQGTGGATPVAALAITADGGTVGATQYINYTTGNFSTATIYSTANVSYSWVLNFPVTNLQISITGTAPNNSSVVLCVQPQT